VDITGREIGGGGGGWEKSEAGEDLPSWHLPSNRPRPRPLATWQMSDCHLLQLL